MTHDTQCPTGTLVALAENALVLAPAFCKRWRCEHCGWRKARALAERIMLARPSRFVTLTVRPTPGLSAQDELDRMNKAWRNVWKRIKRLYGDRARGYVRVVELHKSGTPHLHLALATPFLPQATLSRWWQEFTSSPIVDIRSIRTERGLARYLSKYLTKDTGVLPNRRKWSSTNGFFESPAPIVEEEGIVKPSWQWSPAKLENFAQALHDSGWIYTHGLFLSPDVEWPASIGASP